MRVCPTTRWHHICADDITGCIWVCKMHPRWFSDRKTRKDTTWSVPIVFLSGLNVYISSLQCEKIDPPSVSQNSPVKLEFFTQHCHHIMK